jgi:TonB family protein
VRQLRFGLAFLACAALVSGPAAAEEATQPAPTGLPHVCTDNYPAAAIKANAEGVTTVAFTITSEGNVTNVKVTQSSGNVDLDAAAIQCASGWRYVPATHGSKPVGLDWKASIQWALTPSGNETPPSPLQAHVCRNYPHGAIWDGAQGVATVSFRIATDGTVKEPAIAKSAGDNDLDKAALACVTAWRYKPATRDGAAVDWPWQANVEWSIDRPVASPCGGYAKVTSQVLAGIRGETSLSFRILQDGSVTDAEVLRTSGSDALDQAALTCIGKMRFDVSRAVLPSAGLVQKVSIDWHADLPRNPPARKEQPVCKCVKGGPSSRDDSA